MNSFLISEFTPETLTFSKPKKHGDYFISKVKCSENGSLTVQFPRMTISSEPTNKGMELEFKNDQGYNKKVYTFLSKVDDFVLQYIFEKSEEWFGKKIPLEAVTQMYNKFIKSPKTLENNCTLNFNFIVKKNEFLTELVNSKNEQIDFTDLKLGSTIEPIAQMKYIIFSKDTSFVTWEISCAKLHKRIQRVPKFGFIEDPDDQAVESEDEEVEIHTFF
jgi:hypothetical protein